MMDSSAGISLNAKIGALTDKHLAAATELRRAIHAHPEIGFEETETAAAVARFLSPFGLEVRRDVGGEGITALLRGGGCGQAAGTAMEPRRVIGLRADLDALAVTEETGLPFASRIPGKMHACGHDMHAAVLAGAAAVLCELREELRGDIKFLFQPAEETASRPVPGVDPFKVFQRGKTGAQLMIEAGALEDPKVDAIVGLHCWPDLPTGTVGVDPRTAMAGNGVLRVRVLGKGGHGATPHHTIDPVPIAASMILALQTMVSRYNDPADPLVLSITTIHAGTAVNVIPEQAEFQATIRSVKPGYIEGEVSERAVAMVRGIAAAYGAQVDVTCGAGLPVTVNDPPLVRRSLESIEAVLGSGRTVTLDALAMTSEDFAYFAQLVPCVYLKLGVAAPDGCMPLHNPRFAPDEGALAVGIKALVRLAVDLCGDGLTS
ncbi:MAG TPA: amidohydrolase [Clostridiales bacterium UBA8153]|nr:amidohydrolase [Clostridiales bacterium UBA8153]